MPKRLRMACCLSVLAEVLAVEALATESGEAMGGGMMGGVCCAVAVVGDWRPLNKAARARRETSALESGQQDKAAARAMRIT